MTTKRPIYNFISASLALLAAGFHQASSAVSIDDHFYLRDGDRVVFYGDSITDQRLYTTFTETFVVTRFPEMDVSFTHSGWGGDNVHNAANRLGRDVFPYNPTVMTLMLGMNDGTYRSFSQGVFDTYRNGYVTIVDKTQEKFPGIRLTLIQPSPYDDVTRTPLFPGGYNAVLVRFGEAVKEIAEARGQNAADLNTPVVDMLKKASVTNPKLSERILVDRVHPGPAGHLIMAGALLKSWNAPSTVTDVTIDAATQNVLLATNTRITDLKIDSNDLTWMQLDRSLPMPIDMSNPETTLAINSSNLVADINQQILRISGLTTDSYDLSIDGKIVGSFTAAQLAGGINLATLSTPMTVQAAAVHKLTIERANLHNIRWRTFQVPYHNAPENIRASLPNVIKALDEAAAATAAMQRATAQPVAHRYELKGLTSAQLAARGQPAEQLPADVGANLALNKKWKSSAPNPHGWDRGLTDGIWIGGAPNVYATDEKDTFPKTVTVDLETPTPLAHIVIGVPEYGSTKTIVVSVSDSGNTFNEIGRYEFSIRNMEKRLFSFKPVTTRYIRLTYLDYHQANAGFNQRFAFTTDLQAFGPSK